MITPQWLELPWREPVAVARQLAAENGERGLIWLDGDGSELGHRVTIASTPGRSSAAGDCRVMQTPGIHLQPCISSAQVTGPDGSVTKLPPGVNPATPGRAMPWPVSGSPAMIPS